MSEIVIRLMANRLAKYTWRLMHNGRKRLFAFKEEEGTDERG